MYHRLNISTSETEINCTQPSSTVAYIYIISAAARNALLLQAPTAVAATHEVLADDDSGREFISCFVMFDVSVRYQDGICARMNRMVKDEWFRCVAYSAAAVVTYLEDIV